MPLESLLTLSFCRSGVETAGVGGLSAVLCWVLADLQRSSSTRCAMPQWACWRRQLSSTLLVNISFEAADEYVSRRM